MRNNSADTKVSEEGGAEVQVLQAQNHRMVGVGRDLCGSPSTTPCRSRVTYSRLHRTFVQAGLEYLQGRRLHSLPGQPVPGLRHPLKPPQVCQPSPGQIVTWMR